MEEGIVYVRPYFLECEGTAINRNISDPALIGLSERAFLTRIIEISHSGKCARSQDLADVECLPPGVRAGDDGAGDCITQPFCKLSLAQRVIPGVLMQDRRNDELDKVVFIDGIG